MALDTSLCNDCHFLFFSEIKGVIKSLEKSLKKSTSKLSSLKFHLTLQKFPRIFLERFYAIYKIEMFF